MAFKGSAPAAGAEKCAVSYLTAASSPRFRSEDPARLLSPSILRRIARANRSPRTDQQPVEESAAAALQDAEQFQVGDVFDDDRGADMGDVLVGADLGLLHCRAEPIGRRKRSTDRLFRPLVVVQQRQQ